MKIAAVRTTEENLAIVTLQHEGRSWLPKISQRTVNRLVKDGLIVWANGAGYELAQVAERVGPHGSRK